jgi:hypothetical protein
MFESLSFLFKIKKSYFGTMLNFIIQFVLLFSQYHVGLSTSYF